MAITKRNNSWQIDYTDISGKRVRKSGFRTKADAQIAFAEALANKCKGISNVIDKHITIKDAGIYYINTYARNHCKEKTFDEYKRIVFVHILPFFQNMKLSQLTKNHVEEFIEHLQEERNLCASTINKSLFILSAIVEKQIENGKIFNNVVKQVKKLKVSNNKARALTTEESQKLISACLKYMPDFYPLLYTALNTGLRRGELVALMWENIDFNKKTITIKHSEYNGKLTEPKSKSSYRKVNMPEKLKKVLIKQKLKTGYSKFVFPNQNGNIMDSHKISSVYFPKLLKYANIGHCRFHDLRHTFGSQLVNQSVNIKYVQNQMGHSKIKTTLDTYGHLLPESNEFAMNILDKIYA